MNQKKIEEMFRVSRAEKWPYPKIFHALKELGVLSYEVKVPLHQITYYSSKSHFQEPMPSGFKPLPVGKYNLVLFKEALKDVQSMRIDYETFLKKIASAGITFYRVEMASNTITYFGVHPGEEYQEKVLSIGV